MNYVRAATVLVLAGCAGGQEAPPSYARAVITDDVPFGENRAAVRAYFDAHDWCRSRTWDATDEFATCDRHPNADRHAGPTVALVRYDGAGKANGFAQLVPVPCRMYGTCDAMLEHGGLRELDFVDHRGGLRAGLAEIGRNGEHRGEDLPSMQRRTVDALAVELDKRYGAPVWQDAAHYGTVWTTPTTEIGVFLVEEGSWVIETYEAHAAGGPPGAQ